MSLAYHSRLEIMRRPWPVRGAVIARGIVLWPFLLLLDCWFFMTTMDTWKELREVSGRIWR